MTTPSSGRMSSKRLGGQEEAGIAKREVSDRSWEFIGGLEVAGAPQPGSLSRCLIETSGLLFLMIVPGTE
jgi:hypothetical protein